MRTNIFNDKIVDSKADDITDIMTEHSKDDIFATVYTGDDGGFNFEVLTNEDGDSVLQSDDIFSSRSEAAAWIGPWVSEVQDGE